MILGNLDYNARLHALVAGEKKNYTQPIKFIKSDMHHILFKCSDIELLKKKCEEAGGMKIVRQHAGIDFVSQEFQPLYSEEDKTCILVPRVYELRPSTDRRIFPRFNYECEVTVGDGGHSVSLIGDCIDISNSGIGVMLPNRLNENSQYVVDLYNKYTDKSKTYYVTVAICQQVGMYWRAGLKFDRPDEWIANLVNRVQKEEDAS